MPQTTRLRDMATRMVAPSVPARHRPLSHGYCDNLRIGNVEIRFSTVLISEPPKNLRARSRKPVLRELERFDKPSKFSASSRLAENPVRICTEPGIPMN